MLKTATLPDYARFATLALCPCPWKGENDNTCRALVHTIYRFPANGDVPGRLRGFDYAATNGHVLHLWRREDHLPDPGRTEDATERILETFASLLPQEGLEITVDRDAILEVLPTNGKVRARHMVAFRATYAGDAEWALIKPLEDAPDRHEELPPQFQRTAVQTFHCLSARLIWNAFQGMGPILRMWLPMDYGKPSTLEGEGTRAMIMPMRDHR